MSNSSATSNAKSETARWSELFHGRLGLYTVVLNLGTILFAVSNFVVIAIMPTAADEIGGLRLYAWVISLFSVGSVMGAAATGTFREAFGHRAAYVGAGVIFMVGLIGAALATNMETLVVWRFVQGLGGGALGSQAYALIAEMFPERLRGRALSVTSSSWGVALLLGPTFGGVFAEFGAWRGAFWTLAAAGLVFTVLAFRVVPTSEAIGRLKNFPVGRLALFAASILVLSLTSQVDGNGLRLVLALLSIAIAIIAFRRDAVAEGNLFPRRPMNINGELGAAFWSMMLSTGSVVFVNLYVTLYLQVLHGVSPLVASYLYAINSVAWTAAAFAVGTWGGRVEAPAIVVGQLLMCAGLVGIAVTVASGPVAIIAVFVAVFGTGIGLVANPLVQRAIAAAAPDERGRTGSSIQAIRTMGHAFGAALAGLVAAAAGLTDDAPPAILAAAMQWVHSVGASLPLIALCVTMLLFVHGRRRLAGGI